MVVVLVYSKEADENLSTIETKDRLRIIIKLRFYLDSGNPMLYAVGLQGEFRGLYRFRMGNYRVIFKKDIDGRLMILTILTISHRKDVYSR